MKACTTVATALALVAVTATAAGARPTVHLGPASQLAHANSPSDHDGSWLDPQVVVHGCLVMHHGRPTRVMSPARCGR